MATRVSEKPQPLPLSATPQVWVSSSAPPAQLRNRGRGVLVLGSWAYTKTSAVINEALIERREMSALMMMFITISARDQSSKGRRRIWAFERRSGKA